MKQKQNYLTLNRYTTSALVLLVFAAASAVVMLHNNKTEAAPSVKPGVGAAVPSKFSTTGTQGWWQGATNKTSMALFHGHDCFTSVEYKTGKVDVAAELQKQQDLMTSAGYPVTLGSTQTLTLQTAIGSEQYDLHQLNVMTPVGTQALKAGQEFGYVQLANGYVKVMAYCDTSDQLPATIPALQSIKFNEAK